jgi:hypothetical protein
MVADADGVYQSPNGIPPFNGAPDRGLVRKFFDPTNVKVIDSGHGTGLEFDFSETPLKGLLLDFVPSVPIPTGLDPHHWKEGPGWKNEDDSFWNRHPDWIKPKGPRAKPWRNPAYPLEPIYPSCPTK